MRPSHTPQAARMALLLAATSLSWAALAAESGGTWRCGSTYTDQPCQGGRRVGLDDSRDAGQKRDADDATRAAQAAADRMEAHRQRLEASGARNRAVIIDNAPKPPAGEKETAAKPRKGKKEVLYASPQGGTDATKKKPKKTKPSGE